MAGVAISSTTPVIFACFLFSYSMKTTNSTKIRDREVCVTVGLSSEVCLVPIVKLILFVIFDYFWGKMYLFLGSLWRALH